MSTLPTTPNALRAFHLNRAEEYFRKYYEAQTQVDQMEEVAYKAAKGDRAVQKLLLDKHDQFRWHETGRTYERLCKIRDMYMSVASLSACMLSLYPRQP